MHVCWEWSSPLCFIYGTWKHSVVVIYVLIMYEVMEMVLCRGPCRGRSGMILDSSCMTVWLS